MKRLQTTLMYLFIATAVTFTSCDAEDGIDGLPGEQGIAGQDGQDGNANVIFSDWIPIEFSSSPSALSSFDVVDPQITEEVVNTAAILVYGESISNVTIVVPFTFANETYYYVLFEEFNLIRFIGTSVNGSPEIFNQITAVRYVIIPPGENSGRAVSNPDTILQNLRDQGVDINNYEEVAAYYNLD